MKLSQNPEEHAKNGRLVQLVLNVTAQRESEGGPVVGVTALVQDVTPLEDAKGRAERIAREALRIFLMGGK